MTLIDRVKALPDKPSVTDTAKALGVSTQFVRVCLQRQIEPLGAIGTAVKVGGKNRWTYCIFKDRVLKHALGEL